MQNQPAPGCNPTADEHDLAESRERGNSIETHIERYRARRSEGLP